MKEGWEYRKFESCLVKVPKQVQVKSKEYKTEGKFPIVSQEAELISGYWDDETIVYSHKDPVVIFGDHTKNIKYIDFDFVVGADGTHILSTKNDINPKFFYYVLKSIKLRELGYARHYKLLKEKYIPVPKLSEQQSIVDYLDSAFAKIDAMKANAEKALNEAKALFQASLKEMLEPKEGWEEKTIGEVCLLKSGNSDANNSKQGSLPYVKVGDMNLKGNETYITVSSTYVDRQENIKNIFPIGTLIFPKRGGAIFTNKKRLTEIEICCDLNIMGVIPNKNSILPLFLYYFFNTIDFKIFKDEGASIPQINNKNIAPIMIYLPLLSVQQSIVETLDSLKSKVDRLQENYDKISQECDALKHVILRRVFE